MESANMTSLAESMEQTLETSNLSVVGEIGEVFMDSVLEDGILRDIPIIGTIAGISKCFKNISDILFAKKLIAFLFHIKDVTPDERKAALKQWEEDAKYRIHVGEELLAMINRCDDTIKARWLSQLFYELVLKQHESALFMRAEKVLSVVSVMDMQSFIEMPLQVATEQSIRAAEPYANSGLYIVHPPKMMIIHDVFPQTRMHITAIGCIMHKILNEHKE